MFDLARLFLFSGWSQVWRESAEILENDDMLGKSCRTTGEELMKSMAEHDMTGMGCF